ncbi:MAG: protein kinase [Chitinivibrionales bacterium]|nr:protein kinase [Chitinivibrionales bacterium]
MNRPYIKLHSSKSGIIVSNKTLIPVPDGSEPLGLGSGTITRKLGIESTGNIYEIKNEKTGEKRAIKLMHPDFTSREKDSFVREGIILKQLDYPDCIHVFDTGEWHGLPYREMELIESISVDKIIAEKEPLPIEFCLALGIFVAKTLDYMHHCTYSLDKKRFRGIIHGDLKPSNIHFCKCGRVKLSDFKYLSALHASFSIDNACAGSLQYIAPEILEEKELDTKSDIFSFGCVLYELLTGHMTFPDLDIDKLLPARTKNVYIPLENYNRSFPTELTNLIHQCLEKNPSQRPEDMKVIIKELKHILKLRTKLSPSKITDIYRQVNFVRDNDTSQPALSWKRAAVVAGLIGISATTLYVISHLELWSSDKGRNIPQKEIVASNTKKEPESLPEAGKKSRPVFTVAIPEQSSSPKKEAKTEPETKKHKEPTAEQEEAPGAPELLKLQATYGTDNLIAILQKSTSAGNYDHAQTVLNNMENEQLDNPAVELYHMRILLASGRINENWFGYHDINDAEFYFEKGRFFLGRQKYYAALEALKKAKTAPCILYDIDRIHEQATIWEARAASRYFYAEPTAQRKKVTVDKWRKIEFAYQDKKSHPFYTEAQKARQAIQNSPLKK